MIDSKEFIPYGKQSINTNDIEYVKKALESSLITQGPLTQEFEKKIAEKVNAKYGVSTNSATSALHIACKALDLVKGDILWTSPITFVASANCAIYCQAKVDFVDIDPKTGLLCINKLKEKLAYSKKNNCLPKIVIPVHLAGNSCDMEEIANLSKIYNFKIIEDASHAIGGKYKNEYIGNCKYSSISIFSFHPVKIMTTGEGGMATTNNIDLFKKMKKISSHGIVKDPKDFIFKNADPWAYEQQTIGYNYRLTDIQAALGLSQLSRLDKFVEKRNILFNKYLKLLKKEPLRFLEIPKYNYSALHLGVVLFDNKKKSFHKLVFQKMRSKNIGVQLHYQPVHLQPFYRKLGFKIGDFPNAESYGNNAMSIPLFPNLSVDQQCYVADTLSKSIKSAL